MRHAAMLAVVALAACGPVRQPRTQSEEERRLLVNAGTAPPEPGRQLWGSSEHETQAAEDAPPPEPTSGGETLTGRASYYSDRLAGHRTASGEPYDPSALTAANRDLPLGTRLRVTRDDTGASVVVRVNDRGPFGDHSRILDLSRAAAAQLDMLRAGVVHVRVEILGR